MSAVNIGSRCGIHGRSTGWILDYDAVIDRYFVKLDSGNSGWFDVEVVKIL